MVAWSTFGSHRRNGLKGDRAAGLCDCNCLSANQEVDVVPVKPFCYLCLTLWLAGVLSGCETTRKFWAALNDLAVGVYKATRHQKQLAHQRATASFQQFSPQQKKALAESGTRYLAVRTADPTPDQWKEIRKDMQKPASRYFASTSAPERIYCVMIWDTEAGEIVGNDCYALLKLPATGALARFDTYTAQYVGSF
jgi:hypothetical protein